MLKTRVIAALVFTPAFVAIVVVGGWALRIGALLTVWLMLWEYLNLTLGKGERYLKTVAYLFGTVLCLYVMELIPSPPLGSAIAVTTLLLFAAVLVRPDPIDTSIQRAALVALGIAYCAGLFPHLVALRQGTEVEPGRCLAAIAMFCTWSADTGAYFSGRFLGRHKLYPKISPKKTVEGAIGGVVAAVAMALLIRWIFGNYGCALPLNHVVAVGTLAAIAGGVGDLAASMLKRSVGAKDSSTLIPGHGGVLDRFDGVMFAAPAVYLYSLAFIARVA